MAEVIREFWGKLVAAVSGYVRAVLDACVEKELISREVCEKVLELNATREERARELLMAICDTIDIDNSQFEILVQIFKQTGAVEEWMIENMERAYRKRRPVPTPRQPVYRRADDPPEVKAIKILFTPKRLHVIADSVADVTDYCLSNGLVHYGAYRNIINSHRSPDHQARVLLLEVMKRTCTDSRCFNLFITGLKQCLPAAICGQLTSEISDKFTSETAANTGLSNPMPGRVHDHDESNSDFDGVLEKFEKAIARVAKVNSEKDKLNEDLKSKEEERAKLIALRNKDSKIRRAIVNIKDEISKLRDNLKMKEEDVNECHMHMKRERAIVREQTANLLGKAEKLEGRMFTSLQLQFQHELQYSTRGM